MILELYRGDDRIIDVVTATLPEAPPIGSEELTFTAKWSVADADADAVIRKSWTDGGIEPHPADSNIAQVTFDAADTVDLEAPVVLPWDIQLIDGDGLVTTVASGLLHITPDVTRTAGLGS